MLLRDLLQGFMDVVQSDEASGIARIVCMILVSLLFLISLISLFLLAFVIEGQSLPRRGAFLLMGLGILAYSLQFLKKVVDRKKKP